jgi:hypothetical protein
MRVEPRGTSGDGNLFEPCMNESSNHRNSSAADEPVTVPPSPAADHERATLPPSPTQSFPFSPPATDPMRAAWRRREGAGDERLAIGAAERAHADPLPPGIKLTEVMIDAQSGEERLGKGGPTHEG